MELVDFIRNALNEDVGDGDHTTLATVPEELIGKARMIAKEEGILSGIEAGLEVFNQVDPELKIEIFKKEGDKLTTGDIILKVSGRVHSILKSERLVLNIMQRMSGIATTTYKYTQAISDSKTKVLDTRKTTPNFRYFEKKAVLTGGGQNHRTGLYDMILIKDNHIDFAGGIKQAIEAANKYLSEKGKKLKIEIEARSLHDVEKIMEIGGVDRIMLDNFTPDQLKEAVNMIDGNFETEASGGITLENIRQYAEAGVDYISVGALTHSYKSLDISLKAEI